MTGDGGLGAADPSGRLGRDVVLYGFAILVPQLVVLLATPVFTRVLGTSGFGSLELLLVGISLLTIVLMAGLDTSVIQYCATTSDPNQQAGALSSGFIFVATVSVASTVLLMPFTDLISTGYLQSVSGSGEVVIAAIVLPSFVVARYLRESFRAVNRPWTYTMVTIVPATIQVGVGLALVLTAGLDVDGVLIGYLVAGVVTVGWGSVAQRKYLRTAFDREILRALLTYGAPLIATGLSAWALMFIDRLILSASVSLEDIGIYALAYRVATSLTLLIYAFNRAWTPAILRINHEDAATARRVRVRAFGAFTWLASLGAIVISAFAAPIIGVLGGGGFEGGAQLVPVVSMGMVFLALVPVLQTPMLAAGATRMLAWGAVVAASLNAVLNLITVPTWGIAGAAWSTMAAFGVQAAIYAAMSQRTDPASLRLPRVAALLAVTGGFLAVSALLGAQASFLARLGLVASFLIITVSAFGIRMKDFTAAGLHTTDEH